MVTLPPSPPSQLPAAAPELQNESFNWRTCWYPITFAVDLPADRPYGFSIFGEPLVIFRDQDGELICLVDRCPHRLAKLSDGQVIQGQLECLYHGWQFGKEGICRHIPHLDAGAVIPSRARVTAFPVQQQQGIIWVWADGTIAPNPEQPPAISEIDQEGVFRVDTVTDLPFDHAFLVENLLDPAHVYISHDRTEMGIRREDASPLAMEICATSVVGFKGRFRRADRPQAPWTNLDFQAPMLVHYRFSNPASGIIFGLALYALPLAYGQSRILVRRYGNIFKRPFTLKPRWLEHLRQNQILEEDLRFIVAQDQFFRQTDQPLQSAYFPLSTCDSMVMEHRRWLDRYGGDLPWYVGYVTAKQPDGLQPPASGESLPSRFDRHTRQCSACGGAYRRLGQIKRVGQVGAIAALSLALITHGVGQILMVLGLILAVTGVAGADRLRVRLASTFSRESDVPGM